MRFNLQMPAACHVPTVSINTVLLVQAIFAQIATLALKNLQLFECKIVFDNTNQVG
jgi:hypothetical protein